MILGVLMFVMLLLVIKMIWKMLLFILFVGWWWDEMNGCEGFLWMGVVWVWVGCIVIKCELNGGWENVEVFKCLFDCKEYLWFYRNGLEWMRKVVVVRLVDVMWFWYFFEFRYDDDVFFFWMMGWFLFLVYIVGWIFFWFFY